jgi:hypothetical protein
MESQRDPSEEGFRRFKPEEIEWYRLWFEFLKLSDHSKWSKEVKNGFGDIDEKLDFEAWWPDHKYLFHKLDIFTIDVIPTEDYLHGYYDGKDGKLGDSPDVVGLVVNMGAKKQDLRDAFEKILVKYHQGRLAFEDFDAVGDVYDLYQKPDIEMLRKILAVYRAYKDNLAKPDKDRKPLWQIEEEVSKEIPLIDKGKATLWKISDDDPNYVESRRRSQHTTVRKYVNYAEEILANVVVGKFPVYTAT